jgi:hypothetical protein
LDLWRGSDGYFNPKYPYWLFYGLFRGFYDPFGVWHYLHLRSAGKGFYCGYFAYGYG